MAGSKKTNKVPRERVKNAALNKSYVAKIKQEYLDYDYLNQLTEEELDWLNRFTAEYLGADFGHSGELVHKTDEDRKHCYRTNNEKNRCIMSIARATSRLIYLESRPEVSSDEYDSRIYYNAPSAIPSDSMASGYKISHEDKEATENTMADVIDNRLTDPMAVEELLSKLEEAENKPRKRGKKSK